MDFLAFVITASALGKETVYAWPCVKTGKEEENANCDILRAKHRTRAMLALARR